MSSSISRRHLRNSGTWAVNKYRMQWSDDTGYEAQKHGIRGTKARDTKHRHGIRGTDFTGYEARNTRDTRHAKHGIRDTK